MSACPFWIINSYYSLAVPLCASSCAPLTNNVYVEDTNPNFECVAFCPAFIYYILGDVRVCMTACELPHGRSIANDGQKVCFNCSIFVDRFTMQCLSTCNYTNSSEVKVCETPARGDYCPFVIEETNYYQCLSSCPDGYDV